MVSRSQHSRMRDDVDLFIRFTVLRKTNIERPAIGAETSHLQGHANLTIQLPDSLPRESQRSRRLTMINDALECAVPAQDGGTNHRPIGAGISSANELRLAQLLLVHRVGLSRIVGELPPLPDHLVQGSQRRGTGLFIRNAVMRNGGLQPAALLDGLIKRVLERIEVS